MCTRALCEGADFVRRDLTNREQARWVLAPQCMTLSCEGFDSVRRASNGTVIERWSMAPQCLRRADRAPVKAWRFGLVEG